MEAVPDILISKESDAEKIEKLKSVKGMAAKSAEAFVSRIGDFVDFLKACGLENKLNIQGKPSLSVAFDSSHPLFGKSIVITGFRNKELEESLKKIGAKLGSSVSKNTFLVIVKDSESEETGKVLEAKKWGIPIITFDLFQEKYL